MTGLLVSRGLSTGFTCPIFLVRYLLVLPARGVMLLRLMQQAMSP